MNLTNLALAAAIAYLCASALLWRTLAARTDARPLAALGLGAAAIALHALALASAIHLPNGFALDVLRTASLLSWEIATLTLVASLRLPVAALGLAALPVGALGAASLALDIAPAHVIESPGRAVEAHVVLSLLAYGILMLAAVQALLIWYQERRLRGRDLQGLLGLLPPLTVMESLLFQMIGAGMALLTLALATGFTFVHDLAAQHLAHKVVLSTAAWLILAVLLWGRWRHGWRGPRAVALTIAGFLTLALAYFGSRFVLEVLLGRSWG